MVDRATTTMGIVRKVGILVGHVQGEGYACENNIISGNDLKNLQTYVGIMCDSTAAHNTIAKNKIGVTYISGLFLKGTGNTATNNTFYGDYPGWSENLEGIGAVMFGPSANECMINALNRMVHLMDLMSVSKWLICLMNILTD